MLTHAFGAVFDNPDLLARRRRRRRRGRDRPARRLVEGRRASSTRRATAPCCRSCTSTATRSPARPCSAARATRRSAACSQATATTCRFVEGTEPSRGAPATSPRRSTPASRRSRDPDRGARAAVRRAPRWPAIVLRTPKGWTGPKVVDGVRIEGTFRAHQVPLADVRDEPRAPGDARGVDAELPARGALRRQSGRLVAAAARRSRPRASGAWARTRTPTAARCACRSRSRLRRLRVRRRGARRPSAPNRPASSASCCATSIRRTPTSRTSASSAPTRPTRTASAPSSRSRTAASMEPIVPIDDHVSPDGPRDGGAERAQLPGLARGLPAHRPPRPLRDLRGVRADRRLDGDAARQVARDLPRPRRGASRSPSLNYLLTSTCWRNDHNGFSHQGPGFMDTIISKKGERRARLPAAGRQLPALGRRPLPAQPRLREPDHHRQAAAAPVARHRGGARALRARAPRSGTGRAPSGRRATPDVVLACAGDTPTLETLAAAWLAAQARAGSSACASSTSST